MASEGEQATPTLDKDDPLLQPFNHGWRREVVHRNEAVESRCRADCYYFTPEGKKLRSLREIESVLEKTNSPLSIRAFSVQRRLLGVGPPHEMERRAAHVPFKGPSRQLKEHRGPDGLTKDERRVVERAVGNALLRSARNKKRVSASCSAPTTSPAAAAAAAAAAQRKRFVTVAQTRRLQKRPTSAPAAGRVALSTTPRVVTVGPKNGALPRVSGVLPGAGSTLLQALTKGQDTTAPAATNAPKRRLKMMVKGDPSSTSLGHPVVGPDPCAVRESAAAVLRRLVTTRPWRLAVVHSSGKLEVVDEPRRQHVWRRAYQKQLRDQATGDAPQILQIGRVRQYATCSLFCSRTERSDPLELPSLRCVGCCCLSHPACVGLPPPPNPAQRDFLCMDCFDRLRHRPGRQLAVPGPLQGPVRAPARARTPARKPARKPARTPVRMPLLLRDFSPTRPDSSGDSDAPDDSGVEEIVVVATEDESAALLTAAGAASSRPRRASRGKGGGGGGRQSQSDRLLVLDGGDSSGDSGSDDDSEDAIEEMSSSLWVDITRMSKNNSKGLRNIRTPPSLVRGAGPPTLSRGPPSLAVGPPSLTAGPPSLTAGPPSLAAGPPSLAVGPPSLSRGPRPPPLQRAPAPPLRPDGSARTVVVNRVTVAPSKALRVGPPVSSPLVVSSGGEGSKLARPRRPSGQGGCKVRITGPPASAAGSVRSPSSVVLVVSPTTATAPSSAPAPASARASLPTSTPSASRSSSSVSSSVTVRSSALPVTSTSIQAVREPAVRRVITVKPRRASDSSGEAVPEGTRREPLVDVGPQRERRHSTTATRTTGSTSTPLQVSQPSRSPAARVVKVTVKCKQQTNGTVVVERPPAAAAAAVSSSPAVAAGSTNGLPGVATRRRPVVVRGSSEQERSGKPAAVSTEPSSATDIGGRRVTRAGKRAAEAEPVGSPPAAKKRSWRAPNE